MQRRVYDQEFKNNAMNMLLTSGKPLLTVAHELKKTASILVDQSANGMK